jgi:DNA-binding CsgD family transcriptional regulator
LFFPESSERIAGLVHRQCYSNAVLDSLPFALFALDSAGTVQLQNESARRLVALGDPLQLRSDRLVAIRSEDNRELSSRIAKAAAAAEAGGFRTGWWLKLERPGALPYALYVGPLHCEDEQGQKGEAAVVVIIYDLERKLKIGSEALQQLFGLTPAEARLACALSKGLSLDDAAGCMAISINTARAQLRSIFVKLNLKRQQELIRLLGGLTMFEPFIADG